MSPLMDVAAFPCFFNNGTGFIYATLNGKPAVICGDGFWDGVSRPPSGSRVWDEYGEYSLTPRWEFPWRVGRCGGSGR